MAALLGSSGSVLPGSHSCFRRGAVAFPAAHVVTTPRIRTLRAVRAEEAKEGAAAKRKPTKASEFRQLNASQIDEEVQKSKRALLDLRIAQRTKQPFKPSDFTYHQVKIAQLLTVKREQEIAAGTNLRQARKVEKHEKVKLGFGNF